MVGNLFWCLIGIAGGAFVSLIFYLLGLKRKALIYNITTTTLISKDTSQLENLKIKYNKNKINTLYSSTIEIQNIGNTIIEKNDFSPSNPLAIMTDGEFILDKDGKIKQGKESSSNIFFVLDDNKSQNSSKRAFIAFDYIPKKETISLFVFHTEPIHFTGKLKDGKMASRNNSSHINIYIVSAIICTVAMIISALIGYVYSSQQTEKQMQQIIDYMEAYETGLIDFINSQDFNDICNERQQLTEELIEKFKNESK